MSNQIKILLIASLALSSMPALAMEPDEKKQKRDEDEEIPLIVPRPERQLGQFFDAPPALEVIPYVPGARSAPEVQRQIQFATPSSAASRTVARRDSFLLKYNPSFSHFA